MHQNVHLCNMVTGKELVTGHVNRTMPELVDGNHVGMFGPGKGFLIRNILRLCGVVESRVPFGYEDEDGFHYGASTADWFFTI